MSDIKLNDLSRSSPQIKQAELSAIARVLDRGWFVLGPELAAFEAEFASYCGVEHAVGVANGTDALELALRALDVGVDDEVIVAPNAGLYSTTAVRAIGAQPVYADVDEHHLNIDPRAVAACMSPRTRVVIATHLFGRMSDVEALRTLCDERNITLLEDCAQAHGARRGARTAGAWGSAAAFSFYPTKNLGAMGDAGMVTTSSSDVAGRLRRLRQYGWESKYDAVEGPARNSRLDEVQAAVLRTRLPHLDAANARRRHIAARYAATSHPLIIHPDVSGFDYVAHLYVVRTDARDSLRAHLKAHGIATDIHYPILDPDQRAMRGIGRRSDLPVAVRAIEQIVSIPCFPELTDGEVDRICGALANWQLR